MAIPTLPAEGSTDWYAHYTALDGVARSTSNPNGVTKAQVGLGNVDNTSDVAKPVSTAQQTALNARFNFRGDFAASTAYALNDVVNSPGYGLFYCIQAHTSGSGAPTYNSTYWVLMGGIAPATTLTVLYNAGWPARPTTRTDVYVIWVDTTASGVTPAGIQTGDRVVTT